MHPRLRAPAVTRPCDAATCPTKNQITGGASKNQATERESMPLQQLLLKCLASQARHPHHRITAPPKVMTLVRKGWKRWYVLESTPGLRAHAA